MRISGLPALLLYSSLHNFYQRVTTADQQQLVLARMQISKGN